MGHTRESLFGEDTFEEGPLKAGLSSKDFENVVGRCFESGVRWGITRWEAFLVTLTVELLCLQSIELLLRHTFLL